ncbi:MAG: hypothetical protein ACP5RF_03455 [Candidatus Micrarchaeia archaeon]
MMVGNPSEATLKDNKASAATVIQSQGVEEKAKTMITERVNSMLELVSDTSKLKSVLQKSGTSAFNSNYIALYVAAQKLNNPEVQENLRKINESIEKAAQELGYTTSAYSTEKLAAMSYKELQVALKAEFGYIPDVFKNVDIGTIKMFPSIFICWDLNGITHAVFFLWYLGYAAFGLFLRSLRNDFIAPSTFCNTACAVWEGSNAYSALSFRILQRS